MFIFPSSETAMFTNCRQTRHRFLHLGFVNKIHIIGKGMIKEIWIAKYQRNQMLDRRADHVLSYFTCNSAWYQKLPNFAVNHADLS